MHDKDDNIIYVGKAVNLYNRVRSYFRFIKNRTPKIERMISLIDHFEYIVVDSELEAFVLENNLIKEYSPKYNTLLKDSKTYPYIKVTTNEAFPRVFMVRNPGKDKAKYFGPYTSALAVHDMIEFLNVSFALRTCNKKVCEGVENGRPCLNYHMNRCLAPCTGTVSSEEYKERIDRAIDFLNGNDKTLVRELKEKMERASEELRFEDAIRYRELLESAARIIERQKITDVGANDRDVVAVATEGDDAVITVFFVRDGKMIGRENHHMSEVDGLSEREVLTEFVKQFYSGTPYIPGEIMLSCEIDDCELMKEWLSKMRGGKCTLLFPKIGSKEKFVDLARENAKMVLLKDKEKLIKEEKQTKGAVEELENLLGISPIRRMEAYDISNTNGFQNVGSMVVFEGGKAIKGDYRKFRIQSVDGPDDYSCMHEVLTRRFLHGFEEKETLKEKKLEESFGGFARFPDLILMDGGKGQVNVAKKVLEELNISIPICGMVKDDNHRTRGLYVEGVEIPIERSSEGFHLITRIQDEAHRFAIEYHKSLRSKSQVHSVLEDIPGVGPARRKALMRSFESLEEIKKASVEELMEKAELTNAVALQIYKFFHPDFA